MNRTSTRRLPLLTLSCLFWMSPGCGDENPNDPGAGMPPGPANGAGPVAREPVGPTSNPKLKEIMTKIGKGPQALQGSLSDALKRGEPAWDAVGEMAHEYAGLAAELGKHEPVKGTRDSWTKLTASFSEAAAELDQAAKAKDKAQTAAALDTLGGACMGCHREHRFMGRPGGGPPGGGGPGGLRSSFGGGPEGYRPPPGYPTGGAAPGETPGAGPAPAKPAGEGRPE